MNTLPAWILLILLCALMLSSRLGSALGLKLPWYRDVVAVTLVPWIAGVVLYLLPLFEFRERIEMRHAAYLGGSLACLMLGALIARFLMAPKTLRGGGAATAAAPVKVPGDSPALLWSVGLLGLISQAAIVGRALAAGGVSLLDRLSGEGLDSVRLQNAAMAMGIDGTGHTRLAVFGAAAFVFVCMVAGGALQRAELKSGARRMLYWIAIGCALLIAFNGVFIRGGRMELVLLLSAIGLAALLDSERHMIQGFKRRVVKGRFVVVAVTVLLGVALAWYFSTGFTKKRIGTASAYAAMEQYHRTKPSATLEHLTAGIPSLEFAALNLSYLPVPLTTFGYYYDLGHGWFPGPFFGQYNFTGPVTFAMRRAGFRDEQSTLQDIRFEVTRDLRLRGYGDNVWPTALRDLALDVGWHAVPPLMLLFGLASQALLIVAGRSHGGVFMAMAPLAMLWLAFSIAHSLFVLESFAVGLYMCVAVLIVQKLTRRPARPRRPVLLATAPGG
ncbi:MAG: hypothetical protein ACOVOT_14820 [Rubrivivax sp.]|jgi:hypothetical protein